MPRVGLLLLFLALFCGCIRECLCTPRLHESDLSRAHARKPRSLLKAVMLSGTEVDPIIPNSSELDASVTPDVTNKLTESIAPSFTATPTTDAQQLEGNDTATLTQSDNGKPTSSPVPDTVDVVNPPSSPPPQLPPPASSPMAKPVPAPSSPAVPSSPLPKPSPPASTPPSSNEEMEEKPTPEPSTQDEEEDDKVKEDTPNPPPRPTAVPSSPPPPPEEPSLPAPLPSPTNEVLDILGFGDQPDTQHPPASLLATAEPPVPSTPTPSSWSSLPSPFNFKPMEEIKSPAPVVAEIMAELTEEEIANGQDAANTSSDETVVVANHSAEAGGTEMDMVVATLKSSAASLMCTTVATLLMCSVLAVVAL